MSAYVVRTNGPPLHFDPRNDLPQHNAELSRLVSVVLEVVLGGNVDSSDAAPRCVGRGDWQLSGAGIVVTVCGQRWTATSHDHCRHHCKLTDWTAASATAQNRPASVDKSDNWRR